MTCAGATWRTLSGPISGRPGASRSPPCRSRRSCRAASPRPRARAARLPPPRRARCRPVPGPRLGQITRARLAGYRNPLRAVRGLVPERIDMGVDYSGAGPVYAIGPGTVALSAVGANSPWAGTGGPGGWIAYQLSMGPYAGQFVY